VDRISSSNGFELGFGDVVGVAPADDVDVHAQPGIVRDGSQTCSVRVVS
jgi:hypothetical protein